MQRIENMPRPEIILVADTVAREKNIDKEDVFEAMEIAIQKAARSKYGFEHDIRATIDRKTGAISLARYREVVDEIVPAEGEEDDSQNATKILLEDALAYDENAKVLSLMSCRRSISAALPPRPQSRLLFRKFAMPNVTNNLKNTKKKSVRLLTEPSNESSSAMLFSISAKRKPFCAAMKLFRGKNSKTATGFALMSLMFAARIKGRRFSFPVLVRNSWPSCLRRRFRKFMTAWLKLWALPVIRVQKRKLPLKPMI